MYYTTLNDNWQIRPLSEFSHGIYPRNDDGWLPAIVPAHWQQLPGLETHSGKVVYRCRFTHSAPVEPIPGERYWLRINGAFYYRHTYFNGVDLGAHEGYFEPTEHDITALLRAQNTLILELDCPDEHNKVGKRMITGVFSHWDCFDPQANPGGIWLPVELHRSGPVRLHHARLRTEHCDAHLAQLRFALDLDVTQPSPIQIEISFAPLTFHGETQIFTLQRRLRSGTQTVAGLLKLREPRRWWTHDLGQPDLYQVTVRIWLNGILSDEQSFAYGVRTFELRDWIPHLNGERFLVKGNNYPPGDMRIATMNRERAERDLALARDCHMNMLRVHAHIDHPAFYDAADAAGILLWQDFPLQWLYRPEVLPAARHQARAMVRLLGNHPSIAIWCMHNEAIHLEDTADESLAARLRTYQSAFIFSWNRDVMDVQLKKIVEEEDPTRPVVRSSGEPDVPYVRTGTDAHAYFGWYRTYGTLADGEAVRARFPSNLRFVTEFGAQSFPNLESSLRFMPDPLDDDAIKRLVERHGLQAEIMSAWYPWRQAKSLAEVIELSQNYQAELNRFYIDRLRYHKYRPTGGIIAFLFVDPYPAVLWSVIDYWRVPKRSYYALRDCFRPQYVFTLIEPRTFTIGEAIDLPIYAVNDAREPLAGAQLTIRLCDPTDSELATVIRYLDLPADSLATEIDRLRLTPIRAGDYTIELRLSGAGPEFTNRYRLTVVATGEMTTR